MKGKAPVGGVVGGNRGEAPVRVVVWKVRRGSGSHGGSWKVAYADFVTAMMALFIVLWVMGQSEPVRRSVALYFRDPTATPEEIRLHLAQGAPPEGTQIPPPQERQEPQEGAPEESLESLAEQLRRGLEEAGWKEGPDGQILIEVTPEGLRIELLDLTRTPFFDVGSALPRENTRKALRAIAPVLAKASGELVVEGHTDARPFRRGAYTNWELSADRANAARRILVEAGFPEERVGSVRGFADGRLRDPTHPWDDTNRRISILLLRPGRR